MEVLKENLSDLSASTSSASYQELLDSQKDLFRRQIDQLENIVDAQCTLTGINPLSQEMAAGALSIKIGKRPRDLLNPKAIKYMQSIFSIKDAITKKESREISALFGVTATQVREFFASQRSRVRKFVRLSREKAIKSNEQNEAQDEPPRSDPNIPINTVPLDSVCPTSTEGPSFYAPDEILPGIDDSDKHFLENIFSSMRKEENFSGQVELMEKILQIQNTSVLYWFLTKGGVMILATWLSQAAVEEQTSVLHVILKVLCHLPLHKALPVHMSAILQSVNKLRFYRTSDISNRARILLSRWSKIFARSQAMRKPNAIISSSDAQDEMLLKRSIGEIMENESRESKADIPEETCTPSRETSENSRKLESLQPLKLLTESTDDSNKKLIRGVSSSQNRGRRKVQLVEQPGQKTAGRNPLTARSVQATQGRPLSADDIQKAKMRAHFMQNKYRKAGNECLKTKIEGPNTCSSSQSSILLSTSKAHVQPKFEEHKKRLLSKAPNHQETTLDNKSLDPEEPSLKKWKRVQIPWQKPPETRISDGWSVGTGQNSKEIEVQKNRIRREKEIMYRTVHEIPSDPKEPWDREMDYDDTLTPEIPTEQLPDVDGGAETVVVSPRQTEEIALPSTTATTASQSSSNGDMPEPDLELLAVLLKNPELVFALTSGQGGSLSTEETVKLLDMIKANGVSSVGSLTGLGGKPEEKVEVSLPSPTPSSNPTVSSGWRQEFAKNPFSQQNAKEAYDNMPGRVTATVSSQETLLASMVNPQQPVTLPPMSEHAIHQLSLPQTAIHLPQKQAPPPVIHSLHRSAPINPPNTQTSETVINTNSFSVSRLGLPNLNARAAPVSVTVNAPGRAPAAFHLPPSLRTPTRQPPPPPQQHHQPEPQLSTHSWRARQGLGLNTHRDHRNENNNAFGGGGLMQAPFQPGPPPRERNEFMEEHGFESWSPDNSPIRSPGYMMPAAGRPYLEPRMNLGHNYNYSPERSRQRNFPGYRDHGRNGNRRGRDRDRRR